MDRNPAELSTIAEACTEAAGDDRAPYTFAHSATYSPEDNKLRIYPAHRLAADEYARVKAAGYSWAPKQECFVAPMWTPAREDVALELCGEIGDEDKTLAERAEERAERFEGYEGNRARDAAAAHRQVEAIAGRFEFGQPILVGHHSEKRARKDAERMQDGMRRAVRMWETSEYWKQRAAGAIRAARHKERPDVRARRIKGIEADARKIAEQDADGATLVRLWLKVPRVEWDRQTDLARAIVARFGSYVQVPHRDEPGRASTLYSELTDGRMHGDTAWRLMADAHERGAAYRARWAAHYAGRLAYERAMLAEETGAESEGAKMAAGLSAGWDFQPGGIVVQRGRRSVIVRVNRKDGAVISLTVAGQSWTVGIEEVTDYAPPSAEAAAAVAKATKLAPLCNYDGGADFARMTEAEYSALYEGARCIRVMKATETHERHRVRHISGYLSTKHGGPVRAGYDLVPVFLTDAKIKPAPAIGGEPAKPARKTMARKIAETAAPELFTEDTAPAAEDPAPAPAPAPTLRDVMAQANEPTAADLAEAQRRAEIRQQRETEAADGAPFRAMREALRTGQAVQVVAAPQLFPTPAHVAARMVELAEIKPGQRIAEPSAGTGALLRALRDRGAFLSCVVHAWEIVPTLAGRLRDAFPGAIVRAFDFLQFDPNPSELFDVVLMNPPFANAADVAHILHARRFLAPGGRIVGICAAGPRQHAALQPLADSWEYLEAGTFEGTNVRTVLFTMGAAD